MRTIALLALLLAGVSLGCGPRDHLRPDHGKASRAYYEKQKLPGPPVAGVPRGLDSEEATAIHGTYRKNLGGQAGGDAAGAPGRVLLLQEKKGEPQE
jgi:hypothetical protein